MVLMAAGSPTETWFGPVRTIRPYFLCSLSSQTCGRPIATLKRRGRIVHEAMNGPGMFLSGVRYLVDTIHARTAADRSTGQYCRASSFNNGTVACWETSIVEECHCLKSYREASEVRRVT